MKDKFKPSVCGVGFVGEGAHKSTDKAYRIWHHMLGRCYDTEHQKLNPSYIGCAVSEDWHNLQVFGDWFVLNYIDGFQLDKDILKQGNKVYSSDTCIFVSRQINSLFIDRKEGRGKYKLGVCWSKTGKKFLSHCRAHGRLVYLGCYTSEHKAHEAYKVFKYKLIVAASVTQREPIKTAMINYVIPEY